MSVDPQEVLRTWEENCVQAYRDAPGQAQELARELVHVRQLAKQQSEDWASSHTHTQEVAKSVGIPCAKVDGDQFGVPGIDDLVDMIARELIECRKERDALKADNRRLCILASDKHEIPIRIDGKAVFIDGHGGADIDEHVMGLRADLAECRRLLAFASRLCHRCRGQRLLYNGLPCLECKPICDYLARVAKEAPCKTQ